uniref:Uncharacterized protein n=1 Tax=Gouania willdenowi TaxID=441366 RepID=A0A8C5GDH3_GOUWI
MRQSLVSLIFAIALFFKYSAPSVALPMGLTDIGSLEQDAVVSLLNEEETENDHGYGDMATKEKGPRVIVVATDPSVWRVNNLYIYMYYIYIYIYIHIYVF